MKMEINFEPFNQKVANTLPDINNAVIITKEKLGNMTFNMFQVGIFSFSDVCFFVNGDKIPNEKVIAYGTYDMEKVQNL